MVIESNHDGLCLCATEIIFVVGGYDGIANKELPAIRRCLEFISSDRVWFINTAFSCVDLVNCEMVRNTVTKIEITISKRA